MNDDLDRIIADGLRHRAEAMPVDPIGYGDVEHRITRKRQRTATFAAAAVMVPAAVGLGWLVGHRDDRGIRLGAATVPETTWFDATTTTAVYPSSASYRCQGELGSDGVFTYFQYCEYVDTGVSTTIDHLPPPTTSGSSDPSLADHVLVVDASGGTPGVLNDLAARGLTPHYELPATRTLEQTMVMPTGADVALAYQLLPIVGVGGFDTWDPTIIGGTMPDGIVAVLVIGQDWPAVGQGVATTTTVVCTPTTPFDAGIPVTTIEPATTVAC